MRTLLSLTVVVALLPLVLIDRSRPALDEVSARGAASWRANNCAGCHRLGGRGSSYGPELTDSTQRRHRGYLTAMIRSSLALDPDVRMVDYGFDQAAADELVELLEWVADVEDRR